MQREIHVIVNKDGAVTLKVKGAQGSQCLAITESMEREMGQVLEKRKTGDYYKVSQTALIKNSIKSRSDDR